MKKFISNKFIVCMLCALVSGGSVFAGNWDGRSVARTERHAQKQVFRTGRMTAAICSPVDASAVAAQAAEDETVVLSENFDKFTAGSARCDNAGLYPDLRMVGRKRFSSRGMLLSLRWEDGFACHPGSRLVEK